VRRHAKASPPASTPVFATLSNLLRAKGSGAPSLRLGLAPLLALAALLALAVSLASAASASAAQTHPFLETFGSAAQPTFTEPEGLAVDQSNGDVLVIDKFGLAGAFA
jgi:hypothetical protein